MEVSLRPSLILSGVLVLPMLTTLAWPQDRNCKRDYESFYATAQLVNDQLNAHKGKELCNVLPSVLTKIKKAKDNFDDAPCSEAIRNEIARFAIDMIEDIYRMEHNICGTR